MIKYFRSETIGPCGAEKAPVCISFDIDTVNKTIEQQKVFFEASPGATSVSFSFPADGALRVYGLDLSDTPSLFPEPDGKWRVSSITLSRDGLVRLFLNARPDGFTNGDDPVPVFAGPCSISASYKAW